MKKETDVKDQIHNVMKWIFEDVEKTQEATILSSHSHKIKSIIKKMNKSPEAATNYKNMKPLLKKGGKVPNGAIVRFEFSKSDASDGNSINDYTIEKLDLVYDPAWGLMGADDKNIVEPKYCDGLGLDHCGDYFEDKTRTFKVAGAMMNKDQGTFQNTRKKLKKNEEKKSTGFWTSFCNGLKNLVRKAPESTELDQPLLETSISLTIKTGKLETFCTYDLSELNDAGHEETQKTSQIFKWSAFRSIKTLGFMKVNNIYRLHFLGVESDLLIYDKNLSHNGNKLVYDNGDGNPVTIFENTREPVEARRRLPQQMGSSISYLALLAILTIGAYWLYSRKLSVPHKQRRNAVRCMDFMEVDPAFLV